MRTIFWLVWIVPIPLEKFLFKVKIDNKISWLLKIRIALFTEVFPALDKNCLKFKGFSLFKSSRWSSIREET